MIADQPKRSSLREHDAFVLDRTVLEVIHQPTRHAIAADDLGQVTVGDLLAIQRAQNEEAARDAFRIAHRYGLRVRTAKLQQQDDTENGRKHALCSFHGGIGTARGVLKSRRPCASSTKPAYHGV